MTRSDWNDALESAAVRADRDREECLKNKEAARAHGSVLAADRWGAAALTARKIAADIRALKRPEEPGEAAAPEPEPPVTGEVERLRGTLEVFASDENWKQGGPCDPNSPSFVGIAVARAALNEGRADG